MTYKIDDTVRIVRPSGGFRWAHHDYDGKIGSVSVVDSVMVNFDTCNSVWFLNSEVERVSVPDTTVQSAIDFLISQGYDVTISKKD